MGQGGPCDLIRQEDFLCGRIAPQTVGLGCDCENNCARKYSPCIRGNKAQLEAQTEGSQTKKHEGTKLKIQYFGVVIFFKKVPCLSAKHFVRK